MACPVQRFLIGCVVLSFPLEEQAVQSDKDVWQGQEVRMARHVVRMLCGSRSQSLDTGDAVLIAVGMGVSALSPVAAADGWEIGFQADGSAIVMVVVGYDGHHQHHEADRQQQVCDDMVSCLHVVP